MSGIRLKSSKIVQKKVFGFCIRIYTKIIVSCLYSFMPSLPCWANSRDKKSFVSNHDFCLTNFTLIFMQCPFFCFCRRKLENFWIISSEIDIAQCVWEQMTLTRGQSRRLAKRIQPQCTEFYNCLRSKLYKHDILFNTDATVQDVKKRMDPLNLWNVYVRGLLLKPCRFWKHLKIQFKIESFSLYF